MIRIYLAAVVLVPLFLVLYFTAYERELRKSILYCLFCLYLSAVFALVGIPNVTYFRPGLNLNLVPFRGMLADLKNSVLNIALFVPLGVFLPVLWDRFRKWYPVVMYGFALSLAIELLQMLTYRATDVNDLITNTLGAAAGFLTAKPIADRYQPVNGASGGVYGLPLLSFSVMFFLHPFLSPLIWDSLL